MTKIRLNESQFKSMVKKMVNEALRKADKGHLNEGFRSGKLKKFSREHGGLANGRWSSSFGNDIYNMTDDEFDRYVPVDREKHYQRYGMGGWDKKSEFTNNNFQPLEFNDGTFMVRRDPEEAYGKKSGGLYSKRAARYKNRNEDGALEYQYENPYLNSIINAGEFKPRGNWGFKGDGSLEKHNLNPRAIKQKHILSTYGNDKFKKADELNAGTFKEKDDDENSLLNKVRRSRVNESKGGRQTVAKPVKKALKENMGRFGTLVDNVVEIFNQIYENNKSVVDSHIEKVKSEGDFKDLETRLAWDVARAAHYWNWDFLPKDGQGFIDSNDSQLTTLFKQALRQSNIEY